MQLQHDSPSHLIIVPTYNEAENIEALIEGIFEFNPHVSILVVDDNSPDGTAALVQKQQQHPHRGAQVHLLQREKKDGLAQAYLAGFRWALERDYTYIVEMDADFSHHPSDLARLLEQTPQHQVVMGARYIAGGKTSGWSWVRKLISLGGNIYAKLVLSLPYNDLTGGFNCWNRKVLESIHLESIRTKGYAFQVELKYRAVQQGYSILEVPIHFRNREKGVSKMSGDIVWEAAFKVFQLRFGSTRPKTPAASKTT